MGIKLTNRKDCKNCINASICGIDDTDMRIECNSTDSLHYKNFEENGRYCATYCSGYKEASANMVRRTGNIELNHALAYMLAGKSEFTLHSTKVNKDFYYKLTKKAKLDNNEEYIYFLNIKQGSEWVYAGVVWYDNKDNTFKFAKGAKGTLDNNNLNVKSLLFVLNKLYRKEEVQHCLVFHSGKCGVCGKKLTTPESILTGLGPQCAKRVGIPRVKIPKDN